MKPGLKPLIAGVALCVVGFVVVPALIILPFVLAASDDTRFLAPGRAQFVVEEPARYYLWHVHRTVFEGTSYNRPVAWPDGLTVVVRDAAGEALDFVGDGSISMSSGSEASQSIGYVDLPAAGTWTVEVTGEAEPHVLAFAESKLLKMFALIIGGVVICLLLAGTGVVLVVIGIARLAQREVSASIRPCSR